MENWKTIYYKAHEEDFKVKYPQTFKDGHYSLPKLPDVRKTNGLTMVVVNFLTWSGFYANRINVGGRMIGKINRTESGNRFDDRKWITSSTKKGTSDLMCSIDGRMVCIEIKNEATKDRLSDHQKKEKARVERSGAVYVVIGTVEQFFEWYQSFKTKQLSLL